MGFVLTLNLTQFYFSDAQGIIRPANGSPAEARAILDWENASRKFSFNTDLIDWESHWAWYQTMLSSRLDLLLLIEDATFKLIGAVTFKSDDGRLARIGVIVHPARRGLGWGRWAIEKSCCFAFQVRDYQRILAEIRSDNVASIRAFLAAGFQEGKEKPVNSVNHRMFQIRTFEFLRPVAPGKDGVK